LDQLTGRVAPMELMVEAQHVAASCSRIWLVVCQAVTVANHDTTVISW
jgi:hypothetical protein